MRAGAQTSGAQTAVRPNGGAQTPAPKRRRPNGGAQTAAPKRPDPTMRASLHSCGTSPVCIDLLKICANLQFPLLLRVKTLDVVHLFLGSCQFLVFLAVPPRFP